jgi:hypothetical protein
MSFYSPAVVIGVDPIRHSEICLTFELIDPTISRRRQTIELSLGVAYNAMRLLTRQRFIPKAVLFRHARLAGGSIPEILRGESKIRTAA